MSTFCGLIRFYTSPDVYATIGMVFKKMLDNSSSKTVMSGVCLDFQLVAPGCVFQVFFRITVQNQIGIAKRVIVDEII